MKKVDFIFLTSKIVEIRSGKVFVSALNHVRDTFMSLYFGLIDKTMESRYLVTEADLKYF